MVKIPISAERQACVNSIGSVRKIGNVFLFSRRVGGAVEILAFPPIATLAQLFIEHPACQHLGENKSVALLPIVLIRSHPRTIHSKTALHARYRHTCAYSRSKTYPP